MRRRHSHTCRNKQHGCKGAYECHAPIVDNYDGWPEAYCVTEENGAWECDECMDADLCEVCGIPEHLTHAGDCSKVVA
jgi:hypothetical protein